MKYFLTPVSLLILLLAGCHTKPKEFTALSFSVESIGIYKFSIEISSDKSYHIRQQNILFDNFAGRERINASQGYLTDEEFAGLSGLVARSRLFKMKDTYGFDEETDSDNPFDEVIYQLTYTQGKKTKYISLRSNSTDLYSEYFLDLLRFLSNYISDHSS